MANYDADAVELEMADAEGELRDWLDYDASIEDLAKAYSLFLSRGPVTVRLPDGSEKSTYLNGERQ